MQIVLDANIIAALVLQLPYAPAVEARFEEWVKMETGFAAPALWSFEVGSALRKAWSAGSIREEDLEAMVATVWSLDIVSIHNTPELQRHALAWAERLGQAKAYDGAYLAVAELMGVELWTADRRLVQAAGVSWVRSLLD